MTEIVDELRATRPRASDALRLQVLTAASRPPVRQPSFLDRVRGRRLALLVPAAAGLAVVSAVAIGVTRPQPSASDAPSAPTTVERTDRRVRHRARRRRPPPPTRPPRRRRRPAR